MPSFKLVNPVMLGSIETSFTSSSPSNAAKIAWETISQHMVNSNPKFAFTLANTSDGKLFHYLVKEKVTGKNVDYSIDQLDLKLSKKEEQQLLKNAEHVHQQGGADEKKNKKSSSSSSSSSDSSSSTESVYEKVRMMQNKNSLISYWWYYPSLYSVDTYVSSIYIPVFQMPIAPYVELHVGPLGSASWA